MKKGKWGRAIRRIDGKADLESLKDYSQVMYKEVAVIRAEVKKWEDKANACDRELKLVETMKRWSGVYNQWYRISDPNKKKAFYAAEGQRKPGSKGPASMRSDVRYLLT